MKYKNKSQLVLNRRLRAIFGVLLTVGNLMAHPGPARAEEGGGGGSGGGGEHGGGGGEPGGGGGAEPGGGGGGGGEPGGGGGEPGGGGGGEPGGGNPGGSDPGGAGGGPDRPTQPGGSSGPGGFWGHEDGGDREHQNFDPVVPRPIIGMGTDGTSSSEHPIAEIAQDINNPNEGVGQFYKDSLAAFIKDGASNSQLSQAQIDTLVTAAKNGEIVGVVPVHHDSQGWSYNSSEVKIGFSNETRETLVVNIGGENSREAATTINYQQGATDPSTSTKEPAVNLGNGGSGESILSGSGNANLPADQKVQPADHNDKTRGLPGLGNDRQVTDDDGKQAKTWEQVKTKLEHYTHDTDLVIKHATEAFKNDLVDNHPKVDKAASDLRSTANSGRDSHNDRVKDLYARAGLNTAPASIPVNPVAPQPLAGTPEYPTHVGNYKFVTPQDSKAGQRLKDAQYYRDGVQNSFASNDADAPQKRQLVSVADAGLLKADAAFSSGDITTGNFALELTLHALDLASGIDTNGWGRDLYRALTGNDPGTKQQISPNDRGTSMALAAGAICVEVGTAEITLPMIAGVVVIAALLETPQGQQGLTAAVAWATKIAESSFGTANYVYDNPTVTEPVPGGTIDESNGKFSDKERKIAERLEAEGKVVERLPASTVDGQKTPDAKVNGVPTEFKTLDQESGSRSLENNIKAGAKQASDIVVDVRNTDLDLSKADIERLMDKVNGSPDVSGNGRTPLNSVRVIGKAFDRTWIPGKG